MLEVQSLAVGAELIGTVKHQDVLDNKAVSRAGVCVLTDFGCPGGSPVDQFEVLIGAADDLAPAGLVQTEEDVAVLVLICGLDGCGVTGDDAVVIDGDGEARFLSLVNEPSGAFGGVGVGVDADGVAGIILFGFCGLGSGFGCGSFSCSSGGSGALAACAESKNHCKREDQ